MKINSIQQNQYYANNNFKGTVSPEVIQLFNKCAKNEATCFVLLLEKGVVAEKKDILKIKRAWDTALKNLIEKVKQMNNDTTMCVEKEKENICMFEQYLNIFFENKKLNASVRLTRLKECFTQPPFAFTNNEFQNIVKDIDVEKIDKRLLYSAIRKFEKDLSRGKLEDYAVRYSNIQNYQKELGTLTEEECQTNLTNLNNAIDKAKALKVLEAKIAQADEKNNELINKIFGSEK